jgi:hypothetical protein
MFGRSATRLLSLTLKRLVSLTLKRLVSLTLKALNSAAQGTARVQPARGRYPGADGHHVRLTPKALHIRDREWSPPSVCNAVGVSLCVNRALSPSHTP